MTKDEFYKKYVQPKTAVYCKNDYDSNLFIDMACVYGYGMDEEETYIRSINDGYPKEQRYCPYKGIYSSEKWFKDNGYEIVKFDMKFTKNDLIAGKHIVKIEDEDDEDSFRVGFVFDVNGEKRIVTDIMGLEADPIAEDLTVNGAKILAVARINPVFVLKSSRDEYSNIHFEGYTCEWIRPIEPLLPETVAIELNGEVVELSVQSAEALMEKLREVLDEVNK